jgi:hypothetical protein
MHFKTNLSAYQFRLEDLKQKLNHLKRNASLIGWIRLFVFLLLVFSIYFGFTISNYLFNATLLFTSIFLFLIKLHLQKQFEKELGETKIKIIKNEIESLNYKPGLWYNGEKYHQANSYSYDLDIFGEFSFFHYVNRCGTEAGEKKLANSILHPLTKKEEICPKQLAIKEMTEKTDFRAEWQGLGLMLPQRTEIKHTLRENLSFKSEFIHSGIIKFLLFLAPLQIAASLIYYFYSDVYQPVLYSFLINLTIAGFFLRKINARQKAVDGLQKVMSSYSRMIHRFTNEKWETEMNQKNAHELRSAEKAFSELADISEWFDRRMNVVAGVLFNGFAVYDLHCAIRLEKWKEKFNDKCFGWFDLVSETDAIQSMATYAFNHPEFTYPSFNESQNFYAEQMAHPLIPFQKNIANDFTSSLPEKIILITGSNMSGKSTFLRTVGLNAVIAQCGLPVNAKKMEITPMPVLTSLRQTDNLHENVSLFHAELLRLKFIRNHLKNRQPTLVLIDEMLRGTNSEDKLAGSQKLIEELTHENSLTLIATHDLELGKLEQKYNGSIRNACFESIIDNNELYFDYKLKQGIARNKNATFLLNKMNIIGNNEIKA